MGQLTSAQRANVYIYKFFSVLGHCIKEVIWLYFTVRVQHCEVYVRKNLDLSELAFLSLWGNGWPSYSLSLLRPSIDNYSTKEYVFFHFPWYGTQIWKFSPWFCTGTRHSNQIIVLVFVLPLPIWQALAGGGNRQPGCVWMNKPVGMCTFWSGPGADFATVANVEKQLW